VLDSVADRLDGHYRLDAVRAHLLELAGEREAALACYRAAARRTRNLAERQRLLTHAARLSAETREPGSGGRDSARP
jgi:predicted RNA polymerase sigma factor